VNKPKESIKGEGRKRERLIARLEKLCPPCRFRVSENEKTIWIDNCPTTRGKHLTFAVDLGKLNETPDEYMAKELDRIEGQKCILCEGEAKQFRDELSAREYHISRLCQKCQDETFKDKGGCR
jgi:Zn-finger nucleic acid-binding protein